MGSAILPHFFCRILSQTQKEGIVKDCTMRALDNASCERTFLHSSQFTNLELSSLRSARDAVRCALYDLASHTSS